ncbi:MAG: type II 3-dehydroquinate dehydratase [Fretibacterium sp.]|nr:type II 3-dehydroquinate dehydratase [Fretibacterium sp.]
MRVLVINGPNINLLGLREPAIYGTTDYNELLEIIRFEANALGIDVECFQSNHEGALVDRIQEAYGKFDGIIINPAAYTHTSVAILDAIKAIGLPTVEVHISDPDTREEFRKISFIRPACIATVKGKGLSGYIEALKLLYAYFSRTGQP